MKTIVLIGQIDASHRLSADVPVDLRPGPVKISLSIPAEQPPSDDDAGEQWAIGIAQQWKNKLGDPAEDLYTLADGEPVNDTR